MQVRFWGVRGSIAVSGDRYLRTGGNTTCIEIEHAGERLILDGGTGLRALGEAWGWRPFRGTTLFTHVHWDHIQGVPFFVPLFHPESEIEFVGVARDSGTIRDALARQMRPPEFPVTLDAFAATLSFVDLPHGTFERGPFRITAMDLEHPDGVVAYRIEAGRRSVVFATDVEHGDGLDERLVRLSAGADLLIHDAQYTAAEYEGRGGPSRRGWGHSTFEQAAQVADYAAVGSLALFHHDPGRPDVEVDRLEALARDRFAPAFAAREGALVAV